MLNVAHVASKQEIYRVISTNDYQNLKAAKEIILLLHVHRCIMADTGTSHWKWRWLIGISDTDMAETSIIFPK